MFNLVAADNEFEREFARFVNGAPDIRACAKLPQRFGFNIEYTDSATNLRYYEPDFVAVGQEGGHYLIETKGAKTSTSHLRTVLPLCGARTPRC